MAEISFKGASPDLKKLSKLWKGMLQEASQIIELLPVEHMGECVLNIKQELLQNGPIELQKSLKQNQILFHAGSIRGAFPTLKHS